MINAGNVLNKNDSIKRGHTRNHTIAGTTVQTNFPSDREIEDF